MIDMTAGQCKYWITQGKADYIKRVDNPPASEHEKYWYEQGRQIARDEETPTQRGTRDAEYVGHPIITATNAYDPEFKEYTTAYNARHTELYWEHEGLEDTKWSRTPVVVDDSIVGADAYKHYMIGWNRGKQS